MDKHLADRVRRAFEEEGLEPEQWANNPGFRYPRHRHPYDKTIYCMQGSIVFHLPGEDRHVVAGERIDIPAGTEHAATVGPKGVICWEGRRPAR